MSEADLRVVALERQIADLRETIRRQGRDLAIANAEIRQLSACNDVACRLYADAYLAARERAA